MDEQSVSAEPLPTLQPPTRNPNLAPEFIRDCEAKLGLRFVEEATGGLHEGADSFSPEDVFNYIYAIFHSPLYRERYAEFLRIDFPRVPLTTSVPLFRQLGALGGELVAWHLLQHEALEGVSGLDTRFPESGDNRVDKGYPKYDEARQRVRINKDAILRGSRTGTVGAHGRRLPGAGQVAEGPQGAGAHERRHHALPARRTLPE